MGLKKQFLKRRPVCKVTFRLAKSSVPEGSTVAVAGDFNDWSPTANPLKPLVKGGFSVTLELPLDRTQYHFRYVINNKEWDNDPDADGYATNGVGGENSIVRMLPDHL